MTTLRPMRAPSLHQFVASTAALALVCFCSCERHHPSELEEHSQRIMPETTSHEAMQENHEGAEKKGAQQQRSTTALTPTPAPTPAQFFPSASPR